jgi:hypothetical protein
MKKLIGSALLIAALSMPDPAERLDKSGHTRRAGRRALMLRP